MRRITDFLAKMGKVFKESLWFRKKGYKWVTVAPLPKTLENQRHPSNIQRTKVNNRQNQRLKYQMMAETNCICLNPKCPTPTQPVFTADQLANHLKCYSWIVTSKGPLNGVTQLSFPFDRHKGIIFQEQGINSIYQILKLKHWPEQLNLIFQQIKQRTAYEIEQIKKSKIREFQLLYNEASKVDSSLSKLLSQKQANFSNFTQKAAFNALLSRVSINFYQSQKIIYAYERDLVNKLKEIGDLVQSFGLTFEQVEERGRRLAIEKTNEYLLENSQVIVNDKIQKLATIQKVEMVKTNYDHQRKLYEAKCWSCQTIIESPKQDPTKLGCLQQFLLHLTTSHRRQIYLSFMSKLLRYEVKEIRMDNFVKKVHSEKVGQVIIIDRENVGVLERSLQVQTNKLWIEVVNKDNKNLAKGMYIVADSKRKDASDILITFLVYEILKSEVENVTLITSDHFGTTLQEVIGDKRLKCIEPKDYIQKFGQSSDSMVE